MSSIENTDRSLVLNLQHSWTASVLPLIKLLFYTKPKFSVVFSQTFYTISYFYQLFALFSWRIGNPCAYYASIPYDSSLKRIPSCHTLSKCLRYIYNNSSDIYGRITVDRIIDFIDNIQQLQNAGTTRYTARLIFLWKYYCNKSY